MSESPQRTVLVIEDDAQVCRLVELILDGAGYRVISTLETGRVLDLARQEKPDLVISDIAMPDLDGYDILRMLQADPETSSCPVVFLSAHRDFTERMRAFRAGVVDYITKPFSRETLQRRVARVFDSLARRASLSNGSESGLTQVEEAETQATEPPDAGLDTLANDPPALDQGGVMPSFEGFPEVLRDVLIVDDNASFRAFLVRVFRAARFRVHEAADGGEGLEMALDRRPWLIVTDIRMPDADGFDFCRKVRSHSLLRQTPLLFLSGLDDYKQRYRALEMGADDFLSKQTSVREMLIRIQLLMKRYVDLRTRGQKGPGMEGELGMVGVPGVLQMCHLSRLTGILTALDGPRKARMRFRAGEIVGAECDASLGEEGIFSFVSWSSGRFRFEPGDPGNGTPLGRSFDHLLLEACRRLDESRREAAEAGS